MQSWRSVRIQCVSEPHKFDLSAYAKRIGFRGALEPTLAVLEDLAKYHACSVPFENLSVYYKAGVQLDPRTLEQKLIRDRRGGYCFEQNGLMLGILHQIGFDVTPLAGRVRLDSPREFTPARTHLFLNVKVEGEDWLCDVGVGVGGYSLTAPIRRHVERPQETPHEPRRIVFESGRFFHQAWTGKDWIDVYEFLGDEMPEIDREVGNWWTSTSSRSKFSQNLMCAIAQPDGVRYSLLNERFIKRCGSTILDDRLVTDADERCALIREIVGIEFSACHSVT